MVHPSAQKLKRTHWSCFNAKTHSMLTSLANTILDGDPLDFSLFHLIFFSSCIAQSIWIRTWIPLRTRRFLNFGHVQNRACRCNTGYLEVDVHWPKNTQRIRGKITEVERNCTANVLGALLRFNYYVNKGFEPKLYPLIKARDSRGLRTRLQATVPMCTQISGSVATAPTLMAQKLMFIC